MSALLSSMLAKGQALLSSMWAQVSVPSFVAGAVVAFLLHAPLALAVKVVVDLATGLVHALFG